MAIKQPFWGESPQAIPDGRITIAEIEHWAFTRRAEGLSFLVI